MPRSTLLSTSQLPMRAAFRRALPPRSRVCAVKCRVFYRVQRAEGSPYFDDQVTGDWSRDLAACVRTLISMLTS